MSALDNITATHAGLGDLQKRYSLDGPLRALDRHNVEAVLSHLEKRGGFSDIYLAAGHPIRVKAHGTIIVAHERVISQREIEAALIGLYASNGSAEVYRNGDLDFSTEFSDGPERRRYRANVALARSPGVASGGMILTMRSLASTPPRLEDLNIEPEIVQNLLPRNGIVFITGPTGSGKSTLLSAVVRMVLECEDPPRAVRTYEAPIEYTYDTIQQKRSFVLQTEVPTMCRTFQQGIKIALRQHPDICIVGEARDRETMDGACAFAMTGHLAMTTLHTNSVAETVRRILLMFEASERAGRLADLLSSTRMIVTQVLVKGVERAQIGLREYLVFDDEIRAELFNNDPDQIVHRIDLAVRKHGQTMYMAARRAFDAGQISYKTLQPFEHTARLNKEVSA